MDENSMSVISYFLRYCLSWAERFEMRDITNGLLFKKDKIFRQLLQCRYFGNMADIAVQVFDGGVLRPLCMVNAVVVSLAANGAFDAAASITK